MTDIVPIPALRPSSEFPTNADRNAGVFNSKAFNWANTSRDMASDMTAIADAARTNAIATTEIANDAKSVTAANKTAAQQAQEAAELAAANAAGSAAFYGRWSELTGALTMPANVTHAGKDWRLVRNLADVTAAEPGVSDAWELVEAAGISIKRVQRTSNVQLTKADSGNLIDITAGTFTQTFAAAATLGDGWWCYLRNSGAGDITLDPNESEQIDGMASFVMYPGEVRLVQCDGTALRSVVLNAFYKTFTSSGTFVKPPGYQQFSGLLWGGGGSGSRNYTTSANESAGGGGGACTPFAIPSGNLLASESFVIGAGGSGQPTNNQPGSTGGTSTFKNISAFGGGGGAANLTGRAQGGGGGGSLSAGSAGGVDTVTYGMPSGSGAFYGGAHGGSRASTGGNAVFGGGGGGSTEVTGGSAGGTSVFGGAGGAGVINAPGNGVAPGGGGGGAISVTSGAGARGELRIWGII